jgi:HEAT repeat protein
MKKGYNGASASPARRVFGLLIFLCGIASAQESPPPPVPEPILVSYERNFMRASLAAKAEVLRDAATDEQAREFMGPLYEYALGFALQNAGILGQDPDMIDLAVFAARGIGEAGYTAGADTLWEVFNAYRNSLTRTEVLKALGIAGKGSPSIAEKLNEYLAGENSRYHSRLAVDFLTVEACIAAIGALGDPSSFSVLFSVLTAGYPDTVIRAAEKALSDLGGDYKQFLVETIRNGPPAEKLFAFNVGVSSGRFGSAEKGEIAEAALDVSLGLVPDSTDRYEVSSLRYAAVNVLAAARWNRAHALVIRHFYVVQTDYQQGTVSKERFLEAIACLGAMGSPEAAQTLALQMGYINSQVERNGEYDNELTMAVVKTLGEMGDKTAYDNLLYISYLSYPEQIKAAAREALNRLKW